MFFVIPGAQGPLMLHSDLEAGGVRFPSIPSGVAHVLTKEKKSRDLNVVGLVFLHFFPSLPLLWCLPAPPAAASTRRSRTGIRFACCTKGTGAGI